MSVLPLCLGASQPAVLKQQNQPLISVSLLSPAESQIVLLKRYINLVMSVLSLAKTKRKYATHQNRTQKASCLFFCPTPKFLWIQPISPFLRWGKAQIKLNRYWKGYIMSYQIDEEHINRNQNMLTRVRCLSALLFLLSLAK